LLFLIFAKIFLGVRIPHGCEGAFLRNEGGIQVLECLAPSSQTVKHLLRTPWPSKLAKKTPKSESGKFTLMEKYAYLLFIEHIWESQKFNKPSYQHKNCKSCLFKIDLIMANNKD